MYAKAVIGAALLGVAVPGVTAAIFPAHPAVARHRTSVGDWQLDIRFNRFSNEVTCRLRATNGRARYQGGAVGFRFARSWDVAEAVYRLDGGPPHAWRDDLPELVNLGTPIESGGLANPTGGVVWIPLHRLESINSIAIQPRRDRRARIFHFRGLKGLYELAQARGCISDSRFVR